MHVFPIILFRHYVSIFNKCTVSHRKVETENIICFIILVFEWLLCLTLTLYKRFHWVCPEPKHNGKVWQIATKTVITLTSLFSQKLQVSGTKTILLVLCSFVLPQKCRAVCCLVHRVTSRHWMDSVVLGVYLCVHAYICMLTHFLHFLFQLEWIKKFKSYIDFRLAKPERLNSCKIA